LSQKNPLADFLSADSLSVEIQASGIITNSAKYGLSAAVQKEAQTKAGLKACRRCSTMTNRSRLLFLLLFALIPLSIGTVARAQGAREIVAEQTSPRTAILAEATADGAPEVERRLEHEQEVVALAWSPDGSTLATGTIFNIVITLWDARTGQKLRELRRTSPSIVSADTLAFTADGKYLVTPTSSRTEDNQHVAMTLWDVATGSIARQIPGPFPNNDVLYNQAQHLRE